eukprot:GHVN01074957.1.p1 GENE.GHVN01074957.1~~GHVN01074957.1.p1  ORF type:complete len:607 (+),score=64.66 GHVN01074957.1:209-2029(+)
MSFDQGLLDAFSEKCGAVGFGVFGREDTQARSDGHSGRRGRGGAIGRGRVAIGGGGGWERLSGGVVEDDEIGAASGGLKRHEWLEEVSYFDLVKLTHAGQSKKLYLAVGQHALFLLKRSLSRLITSGEVPFASIDKFVVDTKNDTTLMVTLDEVEMPDGWTDPKFFVSSVNRTVLIEHIEVCWRTDYIFRLGRCGIFPLYQHRLNMGDKETQSFSRVEPFIGYQSAEYEGYFFFLQEDFEDRATAAASTNTGQYIDPRGFEVSIQAQQPVQIRYLQQINRDHVRWVAADLRKAISIQMRHNVVIRNSQYMKKYDLGDDLCEWTGWQLVLRNPVEALSCMILRRMYLPPLMDSCQDFIIIFRIRTEDMKFNRVSENDLLRESELAADSFTPICQNHVWYKELVQAKLDALPYDEATYHWFSTRMKLQPRVLAGAKAVLRSVLNKLHSVSILADTDLFYLEALQISTVVPDDPFELIEDMVKHAEGVDVLALTNQQEISKLNEYRMKLARYLAYALDGPLTGGRFTLADIAEAVGFAARKHPTMDRKMRQLMSFLLHLRSSDFTTPYEETALSKVIDEPDFTSKYVLNESVLSVFFDIGYVAKMFPQG